MSQVFPFSCRSSVESLGLDYVAKFPPFVAPCGFPANPNGAFRASQATLVANQVPGSDGFVVYTLQHSSNFCGVTTVSSYVLAEPCALVDYPDMVIYFWGLAVALVVVAAVEFVRKAAI